MPIQPPKTLIEQMERLGLATPRQVQAVAGRVRRLAPGLSQFDTVWIDALARARILTPYQAAELNSGRGERLRVGPFRIQRPLDWRGWPACYLASRTPDNALAIVAVLESADSDAWAGSLARLADEGGRLEAAGLAPVREAGVECGRAWAACRPVVGLSAAEWMIRHGRFRPECVLEFARQMLVALAALEGSGTCHGNVAAGCAILEPRGDVVLVMPGLASLFRPEEFCVRPGLPPEACDTLAPERGRGSPPSMAADLYASGCLWWQMLAGRPPHPGATVLAKLTRARTEPIADVRDLAADTPESLAAIIAQCVRRDPGERPQSAAELGARLGSPTIAGRRALIQCLSRPARQRPGLIPSVRAMRRSSDAPMWLAAALGVLVVVIGLLWTAGRSAWKRAEPPRPADETEGSSASDMRPVLPPHGETSGSSRTPIADTDAGLAHELVLPAERPNDGATLRFEPGQRVRGLGNRRAVVLVPAGGLEVRPEDVQFENIEFSSAQAGGPLIRLLAGRARFSRCTFRGPPQDGRAASGQRGTVEDPSPVAALSWIHPTGREDLLALSNGSLDLRDCVFQRVGPALDCQTAGALVIDVHNCLHLGSGPLLGLARPPHADEPLVLKLTATTLRGAGPLLEIRGELQGRPSPITIRSDDCVLEVARPWPVLAFRDTAAPEPLLEAVRWTGQGSIVAPGSAVAGWIQADGRVVALDDSAASIAGLVRSEIEFAGAMTGDPAASRLIRWQAPLQSANPPGIDARSLQPSAGP